MNRYYHATLLIWVFAFAHAAASQVDFLFSGTITNDRDDLNWFQGAFPLNGTFNGRIRYDTSMPSRFDNPNGTFSQFTFNLSPADPVAMSVSGTGGHVFSSTTPFYINTYDNYGVNPSYPDVSPFDELYYASYPNFNFDGSPLTMNYYFADFGVHFNSTVLTSTTTTDLPTTPPNVSAFQNSYFNIYVFSGNGNGPLAYIQGTITSVTPVPEPATGVLLLLGVGMLFSRKRSLGEDCSRRLVAPKSDEGGSQTEVEAKAGNSGLSDGIPLGFGCGGATTDDGGRLGRIQARVPMRTVSGGVSGIWSVNSRFSASMVMGSPFFTSAIAPPRLMQPPVRHGRGLLQRHRTVSLSDWRQASADQASFPRPVPIEVRSNAKAFRPRPI